MGINFLEVLDRAHKGPFCEARNWDLKVIPAMVKEKLKKYELIGTFQPENPVNTDDGLADQFWKAGFELAVDTGMLCIETKRIIKFSEEELKEVVREAPSEIIAGTGEDRVTIISRKVEDRNSPMTMFGPMGIAFPEELFLPIVMSCIQYRLIDFPSLPQLYTVQGREVRTGTPYETLAGKHEVALAREALRKGQRPGMPLEGISVSPSEYGQLGGYGVPGGLKTTDFSCILAISELKTSYKLLHKVAHDIVNCGGIGTGNHFSIIGGYVGPAEGAAIAAIAATLLQRAVHFLSLVSGLVLDFRYMGNSGRDAVWASSIAQQAQNRNTNMLTYGLTSQVSGPSTAELLYETAVIAIADVTSGVSEMKGTRPTGCKYEGYASGLENKFAAEVTKFAAGLKRGLANEIAKELIPRYESKLRSPPKGKSFTECTDLRTLKPSKEWLDIYQKVKRELIDLGFPFQ